MESSIVIAALSRWPVSRLAIFRMLVQKVSLVLRRAIAQRLQIPAATLSFHLSQLRHAGANEKSRIKLTIA